MTNHYTFECPITQAAQKLEDCERRHNDIMQGKHAEIEPRICSVAHQCFMCPMRSAFRVRGPWAQPGSKPHWDAPRDKPATLPKEILQHALYHTLPNKMIYARAGLDGAVLEFNDHLESLQRGGKVVDPPEYLRRPKKGKQSAGRKRGGKNKAIEEAQTGDYAAAVNEAVANEKAHGSAQESTKGEPAPNTPEKPAKRTQGAHTRETGGSEKKLSLAERAKRMKQRKAGQ